MADSIIRLRVDSQEYDNKLKRAAQGLQQYIDGCRKVGGTLEVVEKETLDYVKEIGKMETTTRSAKGALGEMTKAFTDLSMEYKRMTDQEKAAPVGKAMSESLDQLRSRIQQTKLDLEDINKSISGINIPAADGGLFGGGMMSGMLQVFGGNVMTKIADVGVGLVSELGEAVKQGIELAKQGEGIRLAFERLGRGDILDGLRKATHGTVTDLELMKAAVQFNDFKLPLEELGTMLEFAQQKAKDTGQSVEYMTQSIVTGLGRKSLMILDNLGLSAAEIRDKMKETGDMTKAVGEIIREQMSKAGDYVETAADRALQANVSLQNKMEELGRKFGPLQEASDTFWTSVKIKILDVVGGPLAQFLNGLTEAGRLQNALNNAKNSDRVTGDINKLKGSNYKDKVYTAMLNRYSREEQAARNNWLKSQKGGMGSQVIWENRYNEARALREEFQRRGNAVLNPTPAPSPTDSNTPPTTTTTTPTVKTDVDDFKEMEEVVGLLNLQKQKLDDLQAMKPFAETEEEIARLNKEIDTANQEYQRLLNLGKEIKTADLLGNAQKKLTDAQTKLAEARSTGDLKQIYTAEKNVKTAQKDLDRLTQKVDVVPGKVELPQVPKEVEQVVSTKVGQVLTPEIASEVVQTISTKLGSIVTPDVAEQLTQTISTKIGQVITPDIATELTQVVNVKPGKVELPQVPKEVEMEVKPITYTIGNLDAFISNLKQQLSTADVGSELYNNLTAQLADATTLGNLIETAIKNGIDIAQFDPQALWRKIFGDTPGDYIRNEEWQKKFGTVSQKTGKKIQFNPQTGEVREDKKKEDGLAEFSKDFSAITGSVNGILSGIQNLGIEIPEGLAKTIGVIQTISGILTAILTITTAIQATSSADATASWLNAIIPFARGGIVPHAANGYYVPGNHYSGDVTPILANAGELVLSRSQQNALAGQLQSSGIAGMQLSAVITGEQLRLVLNNNGRRTGRGEYVTTNFR